MIMRRYRTTSAFEQLKPDDVLTVYHGTDSSQCIEFLERGIDGTVEHYRTHNQGRERGVYVTPDKKTAFDFGNWVLAFHVKARYLYPTQRWGLGGQRKNLKSSSLLEPYEKSFRPLVSFQLNERVEPQAMFIGYIPASKIVSVHYVYPGTTTQETYTVKEARQHLKLSGSGIEWDLSMSGKDIIDAITKEHSLEPGELLGILKDYDIDLFAHEQRLPRKLKLRLAEYLKHKGPSNMSLKAIARELNLRGVATTMVIAAGKEFDRKALHNKLSELRQAANGWNTKTHGINDVQKKCSEISALINNVQDSFPVSSGTKEMVVASLNLIAKHLFGGPYPKEADAEDKKLIAMFKNFLALEQRYIKDVASADSIGEFCAAIHFVVKTFASHLDQYTNSADED